MKLKHRLTLSVLVAGVISTGLAANAQACTPEVYLHRGGIHLGVTEQTMPNFVLAGSAGAKLFEGDIRFGAGSANPTPVLMHNSTLSLFNCSESVSTVTYTWMQNNCVSDTGQVPATLSQFTSFMKSVGGKAWLELKVNPTDVQWNALESRLGSLKSRVVLQSFIGDALEEADQRGYVTAYLSSTAVAPLNLPAGTQWYAPSYTAVTEAQVAAMHQIGVSVAVWTPDPNLWGSLPSNLDAIISNYLTQPLSAARKK